MLSYALEYYFEPYNHLACYIYVTLFYLQCYIVEMVNREIDKLVGNILIRVVIAICMARNCLVSYIAEAKKNLGYLLEEIALSNIDYYVAIH